MSGHCPRAADMPVSADALFEWHRRPGAFERLAPPWQRIAVMARSGESQQPGSRLTLRLHAGPAHLD